MTSRVVLDPIALARLLNDPNGDPAKGLVRDGLKVARQAKQLLRTPGHGRTYTHGSVHHTASAPGDPPATDTGQLAASIDQELAVDGRGLVERIGTNLKKGRALELGTRTIEPRPFLRPALDVLKGSR
jgi:hypothetical protein